MKPAKNSKDNKSGQRSSTASQGKVPSSSSSTSKSKSQSRDPDSSIDLIEDEFDSYEPPKSRGGKGAKTRKQWKSQDFLKSPETRSKTKLKLQIKQEPISPVKSAEAQCCQRVVSDL